MNWLVRVARSIHSLYMRLTGRRYWRAASPSGTVPLGFLTDTEAFKVGRELGRVSYVDQEKCVIFFDTQSGSQFIEVK